MARRSYAEMAAEAGMSVEAYKAQLQAKKGEAFTAPTKKATVTDADSDEGDSGEEGDDLSRIKLCESRGIFGIIPHKNRSYVTLVRRPFYEVETTTEHPRWGTKVYPAGSHGAWQMTKAVYPSSIERALLYVADALQNELLENDEAEDIRNVVAHMEQIKREIIENFQRP